VFRRADTAANPRSSPTAAALSSHSIAAWTQSVAVWIRTVDRRTEKVKTETDDASTITAIINASGWPYDLGWVELEGRQQQFVALAYVVSIEARERTGGEGE
jgi:hypothetical protein